MKIFSNKEIRDIEKATLKAQQITELELIERVAAGVVKEVKSICEPTEPLWVLAGWGNNGADALETARLLALEGYRPKVFLFNIEGNRLNDNCKTLRDRLLETKGVSLLEITGAEPFQWEDPTPATTVIDGLFGAGLNKALPRAFQMIARNINQSGATVVSIDIPSGLFAEWNGMMSRQDMLHADLTLAVGFPRLAFLLSDNKEVVGRWKTIPVGYDGATVRDAPFSFFLVDRPMVSRYLARRDRFASKADFGSALIFAGQRGMMGAAVLAARGALRSGAGKVTVHSAADGMNVLQTSVPCAMFNSDAKAEYITSMPYNTKYNAVCAGPGIGTEEATAVALGRFIKSASASGQRVVLDADALNIIASHPDYLNHVPALSVLTPHVVEFDRIFGECESDEERLKKAIQCAEEYSIIIILKGRYTAIVRPDGKILFNSSGTPAMATPGSGDVLTGIITGLMATGLESEIAAFVGPYVHGIAGEIAAKEHGEYGVTAEDIAANVGKAIKQIMND